MVGLVISKRNRAVGTQPARIPQTGFIMATKKTKKTATKEPKKITESKHEGCIIVLGQICGDSANGKSKIKGMGPLMRLVKSSAPAGIKVLFKPHPKSREAIIPIYTAKNFDGVTLAVTINSADIAKTIKAGVPVLAFCSDSEDAQKTTIATIKADIAEIINGKG